MEKDHQTNANQSVVVSWLAMGLAIIALVFAGIAFNRSGPDIDTMIAQEVAEIETNAEIAIARAEARAELLAIRSEILLGTAGEQIAEDIAAVRSELAAAYADASVELQQEWQEIDTGLEALEQQARTNSAEALDTIEGLIAALERDVRTDEE